MNPDTVAVLKDMNFTTTSDSGGAESPGLSPITVVARPTVGTPETGPAAGRSGWERLFAAHADLIGLHARELTALASKLRARGTPPAEVRRQVLDELAKREANAKGRFTAAEAALNDAVTQTAREWFESEALLRGTEQARAGLDAIAPAA